MLVYVATDGSDSNDGLTPEAPVASVAKAESLLPPVGRHVINFAAGEYETDSFNVRGGSEACVNGVSYRAGPMVPRSVEHGPHSEPLACAEALHDGKTRLIFARGGWTPSAHVGWFLRITRGSNLVIFELPASRNGERHIDLDVGRMLVGGTHLAELLQPGDLCEWVRPAVELRSSPSTGNLGSVCINGRGAGFWNFDDGSHPGGLNGPTFKGIAFTGAVFSAAAFNISYSQCSFESIDNNWLGGSAHFSNCTSRGMQFQGGFSVEHDQAGCLPDSAESPIHQDVDAPSMELLCVGQITVGRGGGASALGASYLAEKNVSVYDATGSRAGINVVQGSFVANPPAANRNRIVAVQGDGNGVGIRVGFGGLARVNYLPEVSQVTGGAELVLEGANPETWAAFNGAPINGNLQNLNGRITTSYPS